MKEGAKNMTGRLGSKETLFWVIRQWKRKWKTLVISLQFSALDKELRQYAEKEMFYFNHKRMYAIAAVIVAAEMINLVNVLVFSKSKLATSNNRQYFFMYLLMIFGGVLIILMQKYFSKKEKILSGFYFWFALFFGIWHGVLTGMDLRSSQNLTVFVTGILEISLLVSFKPWQALCVFIGSYLLLFFLPGSFGDGVYINSGIVAFVAVLISCSRYLNMIEDIGYRLKMIQQDNRNKKRRNELEVLKKRHHMVLNQAKDVIFEWNMADKFLFSAGWDTIFNVGGNKNREEYDFPLLLKTIHPDDLPVFWRFLERLIKGPDQAEAEIRLRNGQAFYFPCKINGAVLCDGEENPLWAVCVVRKLEKGR